MTLGIELQTRRCPLNEAEERRIRHHLRALERRLAHFPGPIATLVLQNHPQQRRVTVDLRVELTPQGSHLISHQAAETADRAARLAVEDVERELERRLAVQRGEPTYGVPSRRLPKELRPHPIAGDTAGSEESREETMEDETAESDMPAD